MKISTLPDTPFNRRMASGHRARTGHELSAVQVSEDGILWHRVNGCCGETLPKTVETWVDHIPNKP